MVALKLTLLGRFGAYSPSGAAIEFPAQKHRALISYLALAPRGPHARERLASLLWSESGEPQARDSLKQALMRLRRSLGPDGHSMLQADRNLITFDLSAVEVDVAMYLALVNRSSIAALIEATALYRGDLLEGIGVRAPHFEEWLLLERQRLRQIHERALGSLMAQTAAAGESNHAAAARDLLVHDPLNEAAYRTLMQIHCDQAQSSQALKLYEGLRIRLQQEMGVRPEPATTALYDRIRQGRMIAEQDVSTDLPHEPRPPEKPSIAVLPFRNLGGDPEQQYFSDGISEDIIAELSRFRTLFVIARHSSFRYRGDDLDITSAGRELGVQFLATGSVRRPTGAHRRPTDRGGDRPPALGRALRPRRRRHPRGPGRYRRLDRDDDGLQGRGRRARAGHAAEPRGPVGIRSCPAQRGIVPALYPRRQCRGAAACRDRDRARSEKCFGARPAGLGALPGLCLRLDRGRRPLARRGLRAGAARGAARRDGLPGSLAARQCSTEPARV